MQVPQFIIISLQVKSMPEGKLHSGTLKNREVVHYLIRQLQLHRWLTQILSQRRNFRQKNS